MAYILRTWACLNPECGREFDSGDPAPYCPGCECAKVRWIPRGGHIIGPNTKHADATLRSVADSFGLTNMNSAREGEAAAPSLPTAKVVPGSRPMVLPGGIQVPRTMTASSSFAATPTPIKLTRELDGKALPRGAVGARVPTQVKAVDKRKLAL